MAYRIGATLTHQTRIEGYTTEAYFDGIDIHRDRWATEAEAEAAARKAYLGADGYGVGCTWEIVSEDEHECESVTTADGNGAYCAICGETLA